MEHTLRGDGVTGRASIWTQANAFFCASVLWQVLLKVALDTGRLKCFISLQTWIQAIFLSSWSEVFARLLWQAWHSACTLFRFLQCFEALEFSTQTSWIQANIPSSWS